MTEGIEILIAKYCSDKLTDDEMKNLIGWIEVGKNKKIFNDYISLNFTIEELKNENQDDSILWKHIESSFKNPERKLSFWKYAVAASIVLLISLTFIFNRDNTEIVEPIVVNNNIKVGTDKATLTLEDGSEIVLGKGETFIKDNLESTGGDLIYKSSTTKNSEISYNYLTIPRGGQYHVKLSDGTQVWLNSESKLKYPVNFNEGEARTVELVYGEAYFDVSPSTQHQGDNFKVIHNRQEVRVLGTEFNIKAYNDENTISTTLVEGKVAIEYSKIKQNLYPNQQFEINILNNFFSVKEVDVKSEISWKDGVFSFKEKTLGEIMKVLSRWYDMDVIFENKSLGAVKFKGALRKHQSIEEILNVIMSSSIDNYEIKDKTLILK
ncbi:FecR family protein [Flavivirga sp. 57AJ16]|uniref:FecR family protein n=1 Tax=Flavivirga sp. 57AJ16 TaxID=3025307 RepID=UPI0023659D3A|nr:FecR family protein [Flavivirga sp. 57AJ16]MDD7884557.1 FecR family protein [Flavivirga sp. 57AJ16]